MSQQPASEFSNLPPCPRTYLIPSILVTLLAFLPIGVVALVFASQVESKYYQGNYEGAKSASNTAKILCITGTGIAALFYLFTFLMIALIATPSLMNSSSKARQSEAKQNLGALNRAQQAFYIENEKFATTIADLQVGIRTETENYRYSLSSDDTKSITTSTAKKSSLKSYTGAVFKIKTNVSGTDAIMTIAQICETEKPSTVAPETPKLVGETIVCPPGSRSLF